MNDKLQEQINARQAKLVSALVTADEHELITQAAAGDPDWVRRTLVAAAEHVIRVDTAAARVIEHSRGSAGAAGRRLTLASVFEVTSRAARRT